jgi:hypothetical protein
MTRYPCPYPEGEVELTDERERHVAERPIYGPNIATGLRELLAAPARAGLTRDQVVASMGTTKGA